MRDLNTLPEGLPVPADDGACDHLCGMSLPAIQLKATSGRSVSLQTLNQPTIIFFYPRTGEPDKPAPADWDLIPGARGCTPQSCGFRDLYREFQQLGYQIFGFSSQDTDYQKEFVQRNHIPFEILSDAQFEFIDYMNLPTFEYEGLRLVKRMAWVIQEGVVQKVFYPIFPPNENASAVLSWLKSRR